MNKIASYLNQHLLGYVTASELVREHFSTDASPLKYTPELIAYPKNTNDIRKIAKFVWQLADKNHVLPITARGGGSDKTGAAIGSGIVMALAGHMNNLFEIDDKQKLIRLQPGASLKSVNDALRVKGLSIPSLAGAPLGATIGGAVANNRRGPLAGKYGPIYKWTHQLEVVLASGEVLQTGRISKRELNKRKGLATFEGEIYRKIDGIIADNKQLIDEQISGDHLDRRGYGSIAEVIRKDGSFDLTPLFVGSQGTLGIVSEMIMKADFVSTSSSVMAVKFASLDEARDAVEQLVKTAPAFVELYSGELIAQFKQRGMASETVEQLNPGKTGVLLLIGYDEFSSRARDRKLKQANRIMKDLSAVVVAGNGDDAGKLLAVRDTIVAALVPENSREVALPLFDGVYVPLERLDAFATSVAELARKHRVNLPLYGSALEGIYSTRPVLQLSKVGDKQKVFKLTDEYEKLVVAHGGHFVAEGGEGRFKATISYRSLDDRVQDLYLEIKSIFDPYGLLNPGVKQPGDLKDLVSHLRPSGSIDSFANYVTAE